jgi:sugar phosphate permease
MVGMTVLLAGSFLLFLRVGGNGPVAAFTSMMLIGFLLFGPDALLGVCAQDVGGAGGAGTAAGVVNGVGSVGAILQGVVTPMLAGKGWSTLYFTFAVAAGACAVLLMPFLLQTAKSGGRGDSKV